MKHLGLFLRGLLAVLAAVVIAACSGAGGGGGTSGTTPGVSDITTATTWQAGQVYTVNGSLSVSAKLTIEPGAVIKFEPYSNYGSLLTVTSTGQIDAQGTPVNPIVFTSTKGSPAAGDWGGIIVDGNSSIFTYCTFSYGGNGAGAVLTITGPGTSVAHCTFTSNVIALDASAAGLGTTVSANEFYANATGSSTVFPLWIDKNVALDDQNVFVRADLTGPNVPQGIQIYGTISSDLTLQSTRAPYVIDGVPVVSAKLTINPGVTVKFMKYSNYGAGLTVTGQIAASGTPALPIKFTSVNDGSSVTPALAGAGFPIV